ncbi:Astacin-like metalloendopeptidase [Strongyloides ratti]|uniref:Metalloendopeptidase n=1 Tax=Strongyloides ratti TaxID=34506 RepID=A0A090LP40_STRRB|nr:Astacin-like metalloendopeptidase [Strongyloides ratti]CEF69954.1 Astacin-like metalloendopeptidase [Strongyloides ratti]
MLFLITLVGILKFIYTIELEKLNFLEKTYINREKRGIVNKAKFELTDTHIKYHINFRLDKLLIRKALSRISEETCFKFEETSNYLLATLRYKHGLYFLTKFPVKKEKNRDIYLLATVKDITKVMRETLHALGVDYEHNRPDRNKYITINFKNVYSVFMPLFEITYTPILTFYNIGYDYTSVMHFTVKEFSRNGKKTIESKRKLMEPFTGRSTHLTFNDAKLLSLKYCINPKLKNAKCHNYGYPNPTMPYICKCLPFYYGPKCENRVRNFGYCSRINYFKAMSSITSRTLTLGNTCNFFIYTIPGKRIKLKLFFHHGLLSNHHCKNGKSIEARYFSDFSVNGVIYCPSIFPISIVSESNFIILRSTFSESKSKVKIMFKMF